MSESNVTILGKDDLLALVAPRPVAVDLPGGKRVFVRPITAGERGVFEAGNMRVIAGQPTYSPENIRGRLVALCACDENGAPLFAEGDAAAIAKMPAVVVEPIFEAAARLNMLGGFAETPAKN